MRLSLKNVRPKLRYEYIYSHHELYSNRFTSYSNIFTQVKECQAILTTAERARICGCVSIKDLAQISVVLDAANENIGTIVGKSRQGLRNLEQDFGVQVELVKETKTSAVGLVVSESKSESKEVGRHVCVCVLCSLFEFDTLEDIFL